MRYHITVVHDLFAGEQIITGTQGSITQQLLSSFQNNQTHPIREDFRLFLQSEVPGTAIGFSLQTVTLQLQTTPVPVTHSIVRPVLSIDVGNNIDNILVTMMNNEIATTTTQTLTNRLDVSSLTDISGKSVEDTDNTGYEKEKLHQTVDSMNAEWLYSVFLCKSPGFSLDEYQW